MSEKISVIVPVYKVEPYLRRCVDSILAQTYSNLELILVDDGSPDGCPAICDEYAKADARVRVIHKTNGGLSDARNAGIDAASGDWIAFIDSDDWIEAIMFEKLLSLAIEYDAQIAVGGVNDEQLIGEETKIIKSTFRGQIETVSCGCEEAMCRYFSSSWSAWDKIYRSSLFDTVRFPVGEINEDEAIVLQLLNQCQTVVYTNEVFYHYIHRASSITTTAFSPKKFAWYRHCRDNLAWIREHHPALTDAAAARYRGAILWTLTEIALADEDYTAERIALIAELKQNKEMFSKINFSFRSDRIRMRMLCSLPFAVYRTFIRIKRSRRTP